MAVRALRKIGDPVLRRRADVVELTDLASPGFDGLVEDMVDTMRAEGGIGIAAPQIGESLRVAVIAIEPTSSRYPHMSAFPLTLFVNPRVTVTDPGEQGFWEGCLSVPNLRGYVHRPRAIRVNFEDAEGRSQWIDAEGFLATVLQHELDHLDGVLFVDRVRDTTKLATVENYAKYWMSNATDPTEI